MAPRPDSLPLFPCDTSAAPRCRQAQDALTASASTVELKIVARSQPSKLGAKGTTDQEGVFVFTVKVFVGVCEVK